MLQISYYAIRPLITENHIAVKRSRSRLLCHALSHCCQMRHMRHAVICACSCALWTQNLALRSLYYSPCKDRSLLARFSKSTVTFVFWGSNSISWIGFKELMVKQSKISKDLDNRWIPGHTINASGHNRYWSSSCVWTRNWRISWCQNNKEEGRAKNTMPFIIWLKCLHMGSNLISVKQSICNQTTFPVTATCGGTTSVNGTYFQNSGYPSTFDR